MNSVPAQSIHSSLCLSRSVTRSVAVLVFLTFLFVLSFRPDHVESGGALDLMSFVIGHGLTILLLCSLFVAMGCFRERIIIFLAILEAVGWSVVSLAPGISASARKTLQMTSHLTWLVCVVLSVSLAYSSVQSLRGRKRSSM